MKKRFGIVLIVLLMIFAGIFLFGAAKRNFELTLMDGDTVILQKNYTIKLSTRMQVFFLYKRDYSSFYDEMDGKDNALEYLNSNLKEDINIAAQSVEHPPKDAQVNWDGSNFTYTQEADGVCVNRKEITVALYNNMGQKVKLSLKKHSVAPSVTAQFLRGITGETGHYSTNYSSSSAGRKHNISLAVSLINGVVVGEGERFSFNETVGERTLSRGFMESKIISGGHFVKGVGGGVCQVSTTLYNAALRSGLTILKVSNHSLPVGYVPLSFDAMVTSSSDLIFENNTGHPIYIKGESDGNNLSFLFYGKNLNKGRSLVYRTEIVKVIVADEYEDICDSLQLNAGEPYRIITAPKCGYISEGYVDVYDGKTLVSTQKLRHDSYMPQKGLRIVPDKSIDNME